MIDISLWTDSFLQELFKCFGHRVWFVGQQGSYGRGEATESSDKQAALCKAAAAEEQCIVQNFLDIKSGAPIDFRKMSETLFDWSKCRIQR